VADFFTIYVTVIWRDGWRIATFTFLFYLSKFLLSGWFCEKRQLNNLKAIPAGDYWLSKYT